MDIETIVGIDSKKELHEEFVRNMNGTTISEVFVLTLPFHVYTIVVALAGVLFGRFHLICDSQDDPPCKCHRVPANKLNIFVKEMLCLALPLLLTSTILSERPVSTPLVLVLAVIVASVVGNIMRVNTVSCVFHWQYDDYPRLDLNPYRRSFVTCCRSMCSICAMITMLAVDFHVFPRKFAKTATYGYSFMDAGVGLFVLSNAVVESADGIRSGLKRTFQTSSALFSFGVIRYYAIEQFNYQNPVGEYGVHWNFFFTLAVVKIFCYCILRFGNFSDNIFIYIVEISLMQLVFWGVDLESYVLSDSPRTDWVDANREGLFSLMGFTSLYLFGVYLNKILMKTSGSITSDCRMLGELLFYSAVTLVVTLNIHEVMPASRRAANLTYVTWIMSLAMLQFTAALAVEIFLVGLLFGNKRNKYCLTTPFIYESINYNRMTFFLLSNLLTGLINIMFDTLEMNAFESLVVLIAYVIVNCGVLFYFYVKRIKLKFY